MTMIALSITFLAKGWGMEKHMDLHDLVSNSHVVVLATCTSVTSEPDPTRPRIVGSTATFTNVEVIRENVAGTAPVNGALVLEYLGGSVGDTHMFSCDMPNFKPGQRYLLFLLNDGIRYMSPLVGGSQGQFHVLADQATGESFILRSSAHGIVDVVNGELIGTPLPVLSIANGEPEFSDVENGSDLQGQEPDGGDFANEGTLMTLSAFMELVLQEQFDEPSLNALLSDGTPMPWIGEDHNPSRPVAAPRPPSGARGSLGACLDRDVYIWFEQNDDVPGYGSNWSAVEDYSKGIWDVHMNIFSDTPNPTDGFGAGNDEDEIAGWLTNSQINAYYGYSWGTAYAKTIMWATSFNCGGYIIETDIMMNAGLSWTTDWSTAFGTSAINYRNNIVHEMGHAWGYQADNTHTETYDYGYPSVMHGYYHYLWEDGKEIHSKDASIIRGRYDSQTTISDVDDVGVESYKAVTGTGLVDSYPNHTTVASGADVKIFYVTVENCSDDPQSNVHERFYLSTNRSLTSIDHLVGDFSLGTMAAVSRSTATRTISTDGVPAGTYYVGVKVSINGYGTDDRPANDLTWSTYKITVTGGVGLEEFAGDELLGLYPNPTDGVVTVTIPESFVDASVTISDLMGRTVVALGAMEIGGRSRAVLDLSRLSSALYLVEVRSASGERSLGRLVKR